MQLIEFHCERCFHEALDGTRSSYVPNTSQVAACKFAVEFDLSNDVFADELPGKVKCPQGHEMVIMDAAQGDLATDSPLPRGAQI